MSSLSFAEKILSELPSSKIEVITFVFFLTVDFMMVSVGNPSLYNLITLFFYLSDAYLLVMVQNNFSMLLFGKQRSLIFLFVRELF